MLNHKKFEYLNFAIKTLEAYPSSTTVGFFLDDSLPYKNLLVSSKDKDVLDFLIKYQQSYKKNAMKNLLFFYRLVNKKSITPEELKSQNLSFITPAAALISDKFQIEPPVIESKSTPCLNSVMQQQINPQLKIFAFNVDYHLSKLNVNNPVTNNFHMKKISSAQEKIRNLYENAERIKSYFMKAKQDEMNYLVFEELMDIPNFEEPIELDQTYIASFDFPSSQLSPNQPESSL